VFDPKPDDLAVGHRERLRRTVFALTVVQHLNGYWLGQGLTLLALGVASGDALAGLMVGAVFAAPALTVFLFGASVTDTELIRGVVWKRRSIPLSEIADLTVGKAERYGPRGMDVNALRIGLVSGEHVMIWESMSCSRKRLLEWAATIAGRGDRIEVHEGYITAESYRPDPSKYLMDFRRTNAPDRSSGKAPDTTSQ
jgi:hypothetical protein